MLALSPLLSTTFGRCSRTLQSLHPPTSSTSSSDHREYSAQTAVGAVSPMPGMSRMPGVSPRCPPARSRRPSSCGLGAVEYFISRKGKWQRKRSADLGPEAPSGPELRATICPPGCRGAVPAPGHQGHQRGGLRRWQRPGGGSGCCHSWDIAGTLFERGNEDACGIVNEMRVD